MGTRCPVCGEFAASVSVYTKTVIGEISSSAAVDPSPIATLGSCGHQVPLSELTWTRDTPTYPVVPTR